MNPTFCLPAEDSAAERARPTCVGGLRGLHGALPKFQACPERPEPSFFNRLTVVPAASLALRTN